MITHWTTYNGIAYAKTISDLRVSLNKAGKFEINARAVHALGNPDAVELLFDEVNKRIGLRPADPEQPNAHPLIVHSPGAGRRLYAARFLRRFGINNSLTVIFTQPYINAEGILVLDLKKTIEIQPRKRYTMGL